MPKPYVTIVNDLGIHQYKYVGDQPGRDINKIVRELSMNWEYVDVVCGPTVPNRHKEGNYVTCTKCGASYVAQFGTPCEAAIIQLRRAAGI